MNIQLPSLECTGCGACNESCKFGAISMEEQNDGFFYPRIDPQKCMKCGQCMRACHALGGNTLTVPMHCYAAQIKDRKVLHISTSGGLFYAFAKHILSQNGVVYGCVYDENYKAMIGRADSIESLQPMHGSKYVWSDPSHSFDEVKTDLEKGKVVLYTGVPCQIAALKKFLRKDYATLFTVDVLCGGAPSPYAFQRYLETLTDASGLKNLQFQFRDKDKFGSGVNCTYSVNGIKHYENYLENSFYFAFSSKSRVTWRKSCYSCGYKSLQRVSDITIGDYWGVEKHHSSFKPNDGVSVVLVNTEKGGRLFADIEKDIHFEESKATYAVEKNSLVNTIEEGKIPMPSERDAFFNTLRSQGWNAADKKYLGKRKKMLFKQKVARVIKRLFK